MLSRTTMQGRIFDNIYWQWACAVPHQGSGANSPVSNLFIYLGWQVSSHCVPIQFLFPCMCCTRCVFVRSESGRVILSVSCALRARSERNWFSVIVWKLQALLKFAVWLFRAHQKQRLWLGSVGCILKLMRAERTLALQTHPLSG